jgi:hypothetical protein
MRYNAVHYRYRHMKKHYTRLLAHLATYDKLKKAMYVALIAWGVFAFFTPFTPGAWLAIVGLIGLLGREQAGDLVQRWLGEKYYAKFHLATFFEAGKEDTNTVRDI